MVAGIADFFMFVMAIAGIGMFNTSRPEPAWIFWVLLVILTLSLFAKILRQRMTEQEKQEIINAVYAKIKADAEVKG